MGFSSCLKLAAREMNMTSPCHVSPSRVSGKAGCGKSTLMKHLYHHETTKELLSQWLPAPS